MEKYTIEELLDDALDTSSSDYLDILDAFDGVKATSENEKIWVEVVCKYVNDYNDAAYSWDMIPANLSEKKLKQLLIDIIRGNICTTDKNVQYYRTRNWPTHDDDLIDKPERYGRCLNEYYGSVKISD